MELDGKLIKHNGRYHRCQVVGSVVRLTAYGALAAQVTIAEAKTGRAAYLAELANIDFEAADAEDNDRYLTTKGAI